MNYPSGEIIEVGDRILLEGCEKGRVVCVIEDKQFTEKFRSGDWSHLKVGFLAEFESMGLVHIESEVETITLVEKGSR